MKSLYPLPKASLRRCLVVLLWFISGGVPVLANTGVIERGDYLHRPDVQAFIQSVSQQHAIPVEKLRRILAQARRQQAILDAISRPAEGKPWSQYRPIFVNPERIEKGVAFWNAHANELARAEQVYGVPAEIVVGIIGVETFYGTRMGRYPVLDALVTLGFDYPPRSAFFRSQLEQLILLADEEKLNPVGLLGSYAGAMGMGQFIPSSYRKFAVDFDGDGKRDLFHSAADAIGSVANYFKVHGWRNGQWIISPARVVGHGFEQLEANDRRPRYSPRELTMAGIFSSGPVAPDESLLYLRLNGEKGLEHWVGHHNFFVITEYNHSVKYALAVFQLAQAIKDRRKH